MLKPNDYGANGFGIKILRRVLAIQSATQIGIRLDKQEIARFASRWAISPVWPQLEIQDLRWNRFVKTRLVSIDR